MVLVVILAQLGMEKDQIVISIISVHVKLLCRNLSFQDLKILKKYQRLDFLRNTNKWYSEEICTHLESMSEKQREKAKLS